MLTPSLSKIDKSLKMPFAFFLAFALTYSILALMLFPVWQQEWKLYVCIILGFFTIIFWLMSQFSDPGFIAKPDDVDFLKLMQLVDPIHLCPRCYVVRTPRSRHCPTCNQCVERYDHHCPWVNNCIGQKNHGHFMAFLTFLISAVMSIYIFTIQGLTHVL